MLKIRLFETCLGWMGLAGTDKGLKQVITPCKSQEELMLKVEGDYKVVDGNIFGDLPLRLHKYLSGKRVEFPDKLDLSDATGFREKVWNVTRAIPFGETRSYGWISAKLGYGLRASRAVGQALGDNPLLIVVPCHRVLSSIGSLGGFSAGLELKKYLLKLESHVK